MCTRTAVYSRELLSPLLKHVIQKRPLFHRGFQISLLARLAVRHERVVPEHHVAPLKLCQARAPDCGVLGLQVVEVLLVRDDGQPDRRPPVRVGLLERGRQGTRQGHAKGCGKAGLASGHSSRGACGRGRVRAGGLWEDAAGQNGEGLPVGERRVHDRLGRLVGVHACGRCRGDVSGTRPRVVPAGGGAGASQNRGAARYVSDASRTHLGGISVLCGRRSRPTRAARAAPASSLCKLRQRAGGAACGDASRTCQRA